MTNPADEIRKRVEELQGLLPRSGGRIEVERGPDEIFVTGDDTGFQRLGIGLLRGTLCPPTSIRGISDSVDIGAYELFEWTSRSMPVVFRQVAEWPADPDGTLRGSRLGSAVGIALAMVALGMFVVGLITIVGWVRG